MLLGFVVIPGRDYFIEYSDDLVIWKTTPTGVHAFANFAQWVDTGPPKTNPHPATAQKRFYRVRLAP